MQKLGAGAPFTVPTSTYGIKVGSDIRMFLLGRFSWNDFVQAVARAFVNAVQEELYAERQWRVRLCSLPARAY